MKFASYLRNGVPSWGIVQDQIVFDVGSAVGNSHPSLLHAIASEALGEAARGKRADRL